MMVGLLLATTAGVLGGLILAPMDYVGRECRGLPYQAALAVGVLVAALPVTYCLHWLQAGKVSSTAVEGRLKVCVPSRKHLLMMVAGRCLMP
jgi:hypothetical protein